MSSYYKGKDDALVLIPENELRTKLPNIFNYLLNFKKELQLRKDSRKLYATGNKWYKLVRPGTFKYIKPQKFVFKGIDKKSIVGLLAENTCFSGANCPGIIFHSLNSYSRLYFLGLLNSNTLTFYFNSVCPDKLGGYKRFNATNINKVPIRTIDFTNPDEVAQHDKMVSLLERMLELNKKVNRSGISTQEKKIMQKQIAITDKQIDKLVYELYDLTEEEIRIVEGEE